MTDLYATDTARKDAARKLAAHPQDDLIGLVEVLSRDPLPPAEVVAMVIRLAPSARYLSSLAEQLSRGLERATVAYRITDKDGTDPAPNLARARHQLTKAHVAAISLGRALDDVYDALGDMTHNPITTTTERNQR